MRCQTATVPVLPPRQIRGVNAGSTDLTDSGTTALGDFANCTPVGWREIKLRIAMTDGADGRFRQFDQETNGFRIPELSALVFAVYELRMGLAGPRERPEKEPLDRDREYPLFANSGLWYLNTTSPYGW